MPRRSLVVLEAFGDPDDHLRLSTLIADVLAQAASTEAKLRGEARKLTDDRGPRSWRDRRDDFIKVAGEMPAGTLVLRDPDAFAETYTFDRTADWDDVTLCRERGEFFNSLLVPIASGAIALERTAPDPRFSERLAGARSIQEEAARVDPKDPYASSIGPDARGALNWLLKKAHLSQDAVDELIEGGVGPELDKHLVLVTYDHLPTATRVTAYRLAVLRGEQALNGVIGPFRVQPQNAADAVAKVQVDALVECGFLRRVSTDGRVRMPRIVRDVVLARADAEDPDSVAKDHQFTFAQLAQRPQQTLIACMIERHHHAVRGLLIDEAVNTAKFYATDLRELATRLSIKEQWAKAAEVYLKIAELDPMDAYAWEYRGYNLLRSDEKKNVDAVLKAYGKAFKIDSTNPLYHGRWLGFRGRIGQDIRAEFQRGIELYMSTWRGMDRFASEVLKGLKRGRKNLLARQLITAYRFLLKHPEVKRIMSEEWVRHSRE
jgi:tetratricopeptide (TPR) repeat protein